MPYIALTPDPTNIYVPVRTIFNTITLTTPISIHNNTANIVSVGTGASQRPTSGQLWPTGK